MKVLYTFSFVFCVLSGLQSQDPHFSQLYSAPLALNPALTGAYDGRYRFSGIYRDQWRHTLDDPYITFAAMLDVRFPMELYTGKNKDAAAVGLMFYNDKVTDIDFNTNQIAVSFAYHKSLNRKNTQYLSLGFQGALAQRNVNYEDLTFEDEFNGVDGYTGNTSEELPANNFSFSDFSIGLNYAYSPARFTSIFAGLSMHHVFEPQMTFYDLEDDASDYEGNKLFRKYSAQIGASLPITRKLSLLPRILISSQGPHLEANGGTNFRFLINDFNGTAFHIGTWVRPVRNVDDSIALESLIFMLGLEYNNVLFGVSYDANLTDLNASRSGQGAFEISVAYLGDYENETVLCPKF